MLLLDDLDATIRSLDSVASGLYHRIVSILPVFDALVARHVVSAYQKWL